MAHSHEASLEDLNDINKFMDKYMKEREGRCIDLCGGMGRCAKVLEKFADTIDVLDLVPGNSRITERKRGEKITCDLRHISEHCQENTYDLVFGNWALCYLNDMDVDPVLQQINGILKPGGKLVLKEPTTVKVNREEYNCELGEGLVYRQGPRIRRYLKKRFNLMYKDFPYSTTFGIQEIYFLGKKEV